MAAAWARRCLEDRFVAAEIRSAGTHAWGGAEAAAYGIDAMRELGFDMREHRSQVLDPALVGWADHVIVMEPMHGQVAADLVPEGDSGKVEGLWRFMEADQGHVMDPQGSTLDDYRASARSIGQAVGRLIDEHLEGRLGST